MDYDSVSSKSVRGKRNELIDCDNGGGICPVLCRKYIFMYNADEFCVRVNFEFFLAHFCLQDSSMDSRPIKSHLYQCVLLVLTGVIFI